MNFNRLLKHVGLNEFCGYDLQNIRKRMTDLQIKVPEIFCEYYGKYAATESVRDSFNRILSPYEWYIQDGKLVFAEENQKVVFWGIDVNNSTKDPKVKVANNSSVIEWFEEELEFSTFFPFLFFYNIVMGTFQNFKKIIASDEELKSLRTKSIFDAYDNGMRIIIKDKVLFAVWIGEQDHTIMANSKYTYSIEQYITGQ